MSSETIPIQQGSYRLERSPAALYPFEVHYNVFKIVHCVSWTLWLLSTTADCFLAYRIQHDMSQVSWRIWVGLLSNILLTIPGLIVACTIGLAFYTDKAAQPRPDYRLHNHVAPSVDVVITCCGEPVEIIINTITAAARQDYPSERLRIFVLDDGHDPDLRYAVNLLKLFLEKEFGPEVIYLSRTLKPNHESYFKSGNLRFGIEECQRFGQRSEFLAGLDADMIAEPDWLKRMVPHLLIDDQVALAASPQVRGREKKISHQATNPFPKHRYQKRYHFPHVLIFLFTALLQCPCLRPFRPTSRFRHLLQCPGIAQ